MRPVSAELVVWSTDCYGGVCGEASKCSACCVQVPV